MKNLFGQEDETPRMLGTFGFDDPGSVPKLNRHGSSFVYPEVRSKAEYSDDLLSGRVSLGSSGVQKERLPG